MKNTVRLLLTGICITGFASLGSAAMWGSNMDMQGTVKSVTSNALTISNDYGSGQDVNVKANTDTKFGSISSLSDLKQGDHVTVSYKEEGPDKVATSITKDSSGTNSMPKTPGSM